MVFTKEQITSVETILRDSIRKKLLRYKPETKNMPFHFRLLGRDRMALYSFIQSLNTTFGISIFEPVAVALAKKRYLIAQSQYIVGTDEAQRTIQNIINDLSIGKDANKKHEIELIRKACQIGKVNTLKPVKVDLFIQDELGVIYLFDLKTVKPNISNFKDFKRTLLEWCAIIITKLPTAEVHSMIAIPYNPYEPEPYQRWTLKGMLDMQNEIKIAEEFWDFLAGEGAYLQLLDCFERVGIELRQEIDDYFMRFSIAIEN